MFRIFLIMIFIINVYGFYKPSVSIEDSKVKITANDNFVFTGIIVKGCNVVVKAWYDYKYYRNGQLGLKESNKYFGKDGKTAYQDIQLFKQVIKIMEGSNCPKCYDYGSSIINQINAWKQGKTTSGEKSPWMIYELKNKKAGYYRKMNDDQINFLKENVDNLIIPFTKYVKSGNSLEFALEGCVSSDEVILQTNQGDFVYLLQ